MTKNTYFSKKELTEHIKGLLTSRGVTVEDIAEIVLMAQSKYIPDLTLELCSESVEVVLTKREVQNALMTGVELDRQAENGTIIDPYLLSMLQNDDGLYGQDEVIPMGIINIYGTISFTTFGYLDQVKPGIIGRLDQHSEDGKVHTFLDDIICAIAASACSRIAHIHRDNQVEQNQNT